MADLLVDAILNIQCRCVIIGPGFSHIQGLRASRRRTSGRVNHEIKYVSEVSTLSYVNRIVLNLHASSRRGLGAQKSLDNPVAVSFQPYFITGVMDTLSESPRGTKRTADHAQLIAAQVPKRIKV